LIVFFAWGRFTVV